MAQLFVGQLPFNKFYPDDLIHLFRPYGVVIAHELYIRTGSGFVTFSSTDEADAAIRDLHGRKVVEGRVQPLQVMYSKGSKLISAFGRLHRATCCSKDGGGRGVKGGSPHPSSATQQTSSNSSSSVSPPPMSPGQISCTLNMGSAAPTPANGQWAPVMELPHAAATRFVTPQQTLTPLPMMPYGFAPPLGAPTLQAVSCSPQLNAVPPGMAPMYSVIYVMGPPTPQLVSADTALMYAQGESYPYHPPMLA